MADNNNNNKKSELEKTLKSSQPDIPEEVTSWLGRLVLLYGVPFDYLIPEEAMLGGEPGGTKADGVEATVRIEPEPDRGTHSSLRFFFLDPIWMQCLVQGACSVGSNGYADRIIDKAMNEWVQPNQPDKNAQANLANKMAAGVRNRLREQYEAIPMPQEDACLDWPLTGFLLRSAVVEGWRGLEVMAYRNLTDQEKHDLRARSSGKVREVLEKAIERQSQNDNLRAELRDFLRDQNSEELKLLLTLAGVQTQEALLKLLVELVTPLKPLRIEQLSKDVMIGLFNGIIAQLVIRQPQEDLHFGLTPKNQSYTKTLRELGYRNPAKAGEGLRDKTIDLSHGNLMRDISRGVINVAKLAAEMKNELSDLGQLNPDKPSNFTSAEFAVEMIEAAGEFTYLPTIKQSSI
jgi:hypothetical protein